MDAKLLYSNFIDTTLSGGITDSQTSIQVPVSAATEMPQPGTNTEFRLVVFDGISPPEIMSCTDNPQTGTLTVTRGEEGTTARSWSGGTKVRLTVTAGMVDALPRALQIPDLYTLANTPELQIDGLQVQGT